MIERLTGDEQHEAAAAIIVEFASRIDVIEIGGLTRKILGRAEVDPNDVNTIITLIDDATVRVSWPHHPHVYSDSWENDDESDSENETDSES